VLDWLESWYSAECDGDWEHSYGIQIDTVDNPGWRIRIDLTGTELQLRSFDRIEVQRAEDDWLQCWRDENGEPRWEAACGARNLAEALRVFREWVETE
jgi:hypothetical protein